jgi:serine/threonine protein phosphatase PrpC
MNWNSFGISDIGCARTNNEDIFSIREKERLFVLADGMGGHNAGEIAAALAVETLCGSIQSSCFKTIEEACNDLRRAVGIANQEVFQQASSLPSYAGMGSTLSCFLLTGQHLVYAHVGDSRLYRYREALHLLTEDHTQQLCKPLAPPRTVITRAIGTHSNVQPDIGVIPLMPHDIYLLCSDGLSDSLRGQEIASILSSPLPLPEKGDALLKTALEKGGRDNITLLLVEVLP